MADQNSQPIIGLAILGLVYCFMLFSREYCHRLVIYKWRVPAWVEPQMRRVRWLLLSGEKALNGSWARSRASKKCSRLYSGACRSISHYAEACRAKACTASAQQLTSYCRRYGGRPEGSYY